jgi:glycosyltransferase involved in cell wall biosynthesis
MKNTPFRLAALATHPIQYHAPIFRALAARPEIALHVYFASDRSVRGYVDKKSDFGVEVKWDIPLLEGYTSTFLAGGGWHTEHLPFLKDDRPQIGRILREERYDGLLLFAGYNHLLTLRAVHAAAAAGAPIMIRCDNKDGSGMRRPWLKDTLRRVYLKRVYRKMAACLAVGSYMRRHFEEHGVPSERIFWSPHCVEDVRFESERARWAPLRGELRQRLGFGSDDFILVFSGKLIPKKDPLIILEACARLADVKNLGLLVLGDGPLRKHMEAAAKRCLGRRAVFVGFQNQTELAPHYVAADALVLPSQGDSETWGLVVNEAQIFGLPAIVSNRVGCREDLVTPDETGLVFPERDAEALSQCIRRMATFPGEARRMGGNAKMRSQKYRVADAVAGICEAIGALRVRAGGGTPPTIPGGSRDGILIG